MNLHSSTLTRWFLACIVGLASVVYVWGIQKDLPFTPEVDEGFFVGPAVRIAATGDLNPAWFGHPGSTIIYPLAGTYYVWNAVLHSGPLGRTESLQARFDANPSEFYLLGRFLSVFYAIMSVPLAYLVGRRAFGEWVGIIGSFLSAIYPQVVTHAQLVRTDTAATFFGLLSLWLFTRLYDHPTTKNQILAGLAIGLSIATRYLMVTLIPVLVVVDILIVWRYASKPQALKAVLPGMGLGLVAIAVAFAVSTPYFILDLPAALHSLRVESGPHPGADSPSRKWNLVWYLTTAIPETIFWPQVVFVVFGVALVMRRRRPVQILLLGFVGTFLVGISMFGVHWHRWIIQILPLLGLFAADGVSAAVAQAVKRLGQKAIKLEPALISCALLLAVAIPVHQMVLLEIRNTSPSTRVLAREWVVQNLRPGSRIAKEWSTAPLDGTNFDVLELWSLATNRTLDDYSRVGYRHLLVANSSFQPALARPELYPGEAAFYATLFTEGQLIQQFEPSSTRRGPIIRIYELPGPEPEVSSTVAP